MAMHPISRRLDLPDGTSLLARPAELQALAHREGVVLLRGVVDPEAAQAVGRRFTELATEVGWLDQGRGRHGVHEDSNDPAWKRWYLGVQRERAFHALPHQPRLLAAMGAILGGEVLVHPRNIARCVGPGTATVTTPPHQDQWYIGGTAGIWTAWLPLVDCPLERGGLAVLPRSHRRGVVANVAAQGAGGRGAADDLGGDWAWEPMRAGDALVFHGLTIHQGCDNRSNDLRLSADLRYQRVDEPVRADSLRPHYELMPWEELYRDWPLNDPLREYWQRQALTVIA